MTSVKIPNSVTSIGKWAFTGCSSLTSIKIPNSITSIETAVFNVCTSLTSIKIPDSVTSIGDSAFFGCSNLTSITIGSGVRTIGEYAFEEGDSSRRVYYKGTAEEWSEITIHESNVSIINIIRYYYSETDPQKNGKYWHYDEDKDKPIIWT